MSKLNVKRNSDRDDTTLVESEIAVPKSHAFEVESTSQSELAEKSALSLPTIASSNKELTLRIETRDDLAGFVVLSKEDAEKLSVKENSYIELYDSAVGKSGVIKVKIDDELSIGWMLLDQALYDVYKFTSESLRIRVFHQEPYTADKVTLSVSALSGEVFKLVNEFREDSSELKEFLKHYIVRKGLVLKWEEKNAKIKIIEVLPKVSADEEAIIFDFSKPRVLAIIPEGGIECNAILLMDISKSMIAKDLEVRNIQPVLTELNRTFRTLKVDAFLKNFKEGSYVKRRSGAALAGLLFLNEKVKRGLDETVGIITFADEAEIMKFENKLYINSNLRHKGVGDKFADLLLDNVEEKSGVSTNMASAIEKCQQIIKQLPILKRRNPLLIILLTDGFDTSKRVREVVETAIAGKKNVILYSVGIGPYVNKRELQEISALCGGEVFLPDNLEELSSWYQKLARDLAIQIDETNQK